MRLIISCIDQKKTQCPEIIRIRIAAYEGEVIKESGNSLQGGVVLIP